MKPSYKEWHRKLTQSFMLRHGVSEEYADAQAIIQRNYYPIPVDLVVMSRGNMQWAIDHVR